MARTLGLCYSLNVPSGSTRKSSYHLGFRTQCYLFYTSALFSSDRFNSYSHILTVWTRGSSYTRYGTFLILARILPVEFS